MTSRARAPDASVTSSVTSAVVSFSPTQASLAVPAESPRDHQRRADDCSNCYTPSTGLYFTALVLKSTRSAPCRIHRSTFELQRCSTRCFFPQLYKSVQRHQRGTARSRLGDWTGHLPPPHSPSAHLPPRDTCPLHKELLSRTSVRFLASGFSVTGLGFVVRIRVNAEIHEPTLTANICRVVSGGMS